VQIITTTRRRRGTRIGRWLVNTTCVLITLLAGAFILPTAFGLERYVITGSSMDGSIDVGSVVFSEVVPVSDLRVGDVITYMPPPDSGVDNLVTHRIVKIKGNVFRTKGDAVPQRDPWTFELTSASQARVKYTVPYVGHLLIALQDRAVRFGLIGLPAGLILLISLGQAVNVVRRRDQDPPVPGRHVRPMATVGG
jgi:signal peptidase